MRVLLVGPPADRARMRADLGGSALDIVGEFATLHAARASKLDADAIVFAERCDEREIAGSTLTPRERQVLDLLAEGLPNKTIAARLGISDQTVKFHVASICGKLGAANRTEAVRRAIRRGLVSL
jgi:DNA-binding NarL/FixJ family response regulator